MAGGASGAQEQEEAGEREKGWDAQSSAPLAARPLLICSPPHPKYQQKNNRHISV